MTFINKTFKYEDKHELIVYGTNEEPWFKGKDVALILGYKYGPSAMRDHVEEEDKISCKALTLRVAESATLVECDPQTIFINESGLYSLILSSKIPGAKSFKQWITKTILPSLRKTGKCEIKNLVQSGSVQEKIKKIKEIKELNLSKEFEDYMLQELFNEMKPKKEIKAITLDEEKEYHHNTDNYWAR